MTLKNKCSRTGAYVLIDNLVQNGVEHIFGYPGGAILQFMMNYIIGKKLILLNIF